MRHVQALVLAHYIITVFQLLAGRPVVISDFGIEASLRVRCTADTIIVESATDEPTDAEIASAVPVLARVGWSILHLNAETPVVSFLTEEPRGGICTVEEDLL